MKKLIASMVLIAGLLVGCTAPVASTEKLEDDPTWNCAVDGNRICGLSMESWAEDAWASLEARKPGSLLGEVGHKVTYVGTYVGATTQAPPNITAVVSNSHPDIAHMFLIEETGPKTDA